jgi:hypothetical protein
MLPRDSEADVETEMSYRAHEKLIMHTAFNSPNDDFYETPAIKRPAHQQPIIIVQAAKRRRGGDG